MKISLTENEAKFVKELVENLYAEPGFSDVEIIDMARELKISTNSAKGIYGSLVKKGVCKIYKHFENILYLHPHCYKFHKEWSKEKGLKYVNPMDLIEKKKTKNNLSKRIFKLCEELNFEDGYDLHLANKVAIVGNDSLRGDNYSSCAMGVIVDLIKFAENKLKAGDVKEAESFIRSAYNVADITVKTNHLGKGKK